MSLSAEEIKNLLRFLDSSVMEGHTTHKTGFKNFMNTQRVGDAIVVDIESKIALSALLIKIQAMNKNKNPEERVVLRVAAGGRKDTKDKEYSASYSATACTSADIVVRLTGDDFTKLSRIDDSNVVRAGTSLQIGELDKLLFEKFSKNKLALPTSSLIPYVTVGGLAAAGGHGTGRDQPSFAGLIRGATIMLENGKEVKIDRSHPDFATIMGANNGMFGVITDFDIECTPAKKMQCVMEKRSVAEFIEEVETGLFQMDPYVSVMYVPTYLPDEMTNRIVNNVIIYRWRPISLETENTNHNQFCSDLTQEVQGKLGDKVKIPDILRNYPNLIPFYMRRLTAPLTIGDREEIAVGPWHEMMHYRSAFPVSLDEICGIFPVEDKPFKEQQGREIVKALQHAVTLLDEHAKRGEYPVTYAMYFRYLQGTNGGLSFTSHPENHHVCAMDLTTMENMPGFAQFKQSMQDFFLNEMNAKFHWGKNAPMDLNYQQLYGGEWFALKDALERWHHTNHTSLSKSALLNPLFSQAMGYPVPSLVDTGIAAPRQFMTPDPQQIARNAKKLVSVLGVPAGECEQTKAKIDVDINRNKLGNNSVFKAKQTSMTEKPTEKSSCTIL